jgi:hypothetical protein
MRMTNAAESDEGPLTEEGRVYILWPGCSAFVLSNLAAATFRRFDPQVSERCHDEDGCTTFTTQQPAHVYLDDACTCTADLDPPRGQLQRVAHPSLLGLCRGQDWTRDQQGFRLWMRCIRASPFAHAARNAAHLLTTATLAMAQTGMCLAGPEEF